MKKRNKKYYYKSLFKYLGRKHDIYLIKEINGLYPGIFVFWYNAWYPRTIL